MTCHGSDRFVEETERRLAALRTGRPQDADVALPRTVWPITDIDAAVAAHFGLDPNELKRHGHRAGLAKFLAVELACRLTGQTQRAIGQHYGGISSAAVSTIRRKIREGNYPLAEPAEEMVRKLSRRKVNIQRLTKTTPNQPLTTTIHQPDPDNRFTHTRFLFAIWPFRCLAGGREARFSSSHL